MVWRWIWYSFHEWDRNFYIFTSTKNELKNFTKKILFHEWNKFHNHSPKLWFFSFLYFLWALNTFLSNLRHYMQCMTWRHSNLLFPHCENNTFERYNFYFIDKTRYLSAEKVIWGNIQVFFFIYLKI